MFTFNSNIIMDSRWATFNSYFYSQGAVNLLKFVFVIFVILCTGCASLHDSKGRAGSYYEYKKKLKARAKAIERLRVGSAEILSFDAKAVDRERYGEFKVSFAYELENFVEKEDFYICLLKQRTTNNPRALVASYQTINMMCDIKQDKGTVIYTWEPIRRLKLKNGEDEILNPPFLLQVFLGHRGDEKINFVPLASTQTIEVY